MDYEPPPAFSRPQDRMGPVSAAGVQARSAEPGLAEPGLSRPMSASATVITVAAVLVAALAVAVVVIVIAFRARGGSGPQRRVSLPNVAGDYHLIRAVDDRTAVAMLGPAAGSLGPIAPALDVAKIGLYGTGGADGLPTVIFLGFNRADSGTIDSLLHSGSGSQVAERVLSGTGPDRPRTFDAGPMGGSLQCASGSQNATAFTPCAWVDSSTLALLLRVGTIDESAAAGLTREFRAAAEH